MISKRLKALSALLALLVVTVAIFTLEEFRSAKAAESYEIWKEARLDEMRGEETTWLNLAGLFWLDEGEQTFGSAESNDFVLTEGEAPPHVGRFLREGDTVYFEPAPGVAITSSDSSVTERVLLVDDGGDESPDATVLSLGRLRWWIIARDGMLGVRVRNLASTVWKAFDGIESFEFDRAWQLDAQFLAYEEPRFMEYPTVLGTTRFEEAPGVLVFYLEGLQFQLIPFERYEGTKLFLVFGDQTNGETTYAGGRFLYVDLPDETGRTTIDFNRAYNPPCAFSPYSTCPQPLSQNRLSVEITAGEKMYRNDSSID